MAAATCISLLAQCVGNNVIQPVVPFIESNIQSEDWRNREAAVMAFGSILDGPDPAVLTPLVDQVSWRLLSMLLLRYLHYPFLLGLTYFDPNDEGFCRSCQRYRRLDSWSYLRIAYPLH